jgi:hypothetical protein
MYVSNNVNVKKWRITLMLMVLLLERGWRISAKEEEEEDDQVVCPELAATTGR